MHEGEDYVISTGDGSYNSSSYPVKPGGREIQDPPIEPKPAQEQVVKDVRVNE